MRARTQVLSFCGSYARGSRTRPSHSKRAALAAAQASGNAVLTQGDVGLRTKSGERAGFAGQRLFSVNAPDLTDESMSTSSSKRADIPAWRGPLSAEDFVWWQSVSPGHAEGRAVLALLLPVWSEAEDACSGDLPGCADCSCAVATSRCSAIARGGRGSFAKARGVAGYPSTEV